MKTAIKIETLFSILSNNGQFRHQALYKLDPGIEGNEYVILSTSYCNGNMGSYNENNPGSGDNSNSQFALLALHEAARAGVRVI